MKYVLTAPETLDCQVDLPFSKSIANRTLVIQALAGGELKSGFSCCDDTSVLLHALSTDAELVDIGAAGAAMRFLTAYFSVCKGEHVLTGSARMRQRPVGPLVEALRLLGADIEYLENEGFPPLRIKGKSLEGGMLQVAGDVSSQFVSALLLVAPVLKSGLELTLMGEIVSRPYIDLTLCVMRDFGAKAEWSDGMTIKVQPSPYNIRDYILENDWSAASYWYEILALSPQRASQLMLKGLIDGSRQGDACVRHLFSMLGIKSTFEKTQERVPTRLKLTKTMSVSPRLDYDFTHQPDLAPTVVCTCAGLGIPFRFTGLASLRIKETDRIEALRRELLKLGIRVKQAEADELYWDGETGVASMEPIDTYDDHRMAMAMAPLAFKFKDLKINHPEVVAKSYPGYWDELARAGFIIKRL